MTADYFREEKLILLKRKNVWICNADEEKKLQRVLWACGLAHAAAWNSMKTSQDARGCNCCGCAENLVYLEFHCLSCMPSSVLDFYLIWFFHGCKYVPTLTHGCNRTARWGMRPPMQEPLAATWDPARSRYVNLKVWTAPGFTQTGPMPLPSLPLRASCQKQRRRYGLRGVKLTRPDK